MIIVTSLLDNIPVGCIYGVCPSFIDGPPFDRESPRSLAAPFPRQPFLASISFLSFNPNPFIAMALPSFIELMASLGLEQRSSGSPSIERSPSPQPRSTPSSSPRSVGSLNLPARSSSSPALKELTARHRPSRYSPYYPGMVCVQR